MEILLTPDFVQAVDEHIAAHPPERMMHALGRLRPDGSVMLSHWVVDGHADTSGSHVRASSQGEQAIQELERSESVSYLGVIHSHPASVPEPSGQDGNAAADLLELNPHMPLALVGVVVSTDTGRTGDRLIDTGFGELVIYTAGRGRAGLHPAALSVVDPVADFYDGAARRLPRNAFDAVRGATAVVIGCGSLGSVVAEQLVRAGVPRLVLIDPDRVEAHNLTRTVFGLDDVGDLKVDALARRLRGINPRVALELHDWMVDPSAVDKLSEIVADADIVLGMADSPKAMAIVDVVLHEQDKPGVFAGVYRGGIGADIVTVLPGLTACYRCTVAPRVQAGSLQPGMDYSQGRLSGAVALGADVSIVALLAARAGLGVIGLLRGSDTLMDPVAHSGRNFLQLGLAPGFFDSSGFLAGARAQHAFQSIWAAAAGRSDCPECGGRVVGVHADGFADGVSSPLEATNGRGPDGREADQGRPVWQPLGRVSGIPSLARQGGTAAAGGAVAVATRATRAVAWGLNRLMGL